jgi:hypothetical protein
MSNASTELVVDFMLATRLGGIAYFQFHFTTVGNIIE